MGYCSSYHCRPVRKTAVYRFYDRDGRLLYAGIAHDIKKRWREHARDKPWWKEVRWQTAVWHNSRLGAAIEEYCAFRYENPIYNKARDYDRRLGWEPTDAPGHHAPRPWRLERLAAAMKHPNGGWASTNAAPHYAVVRHADQSLASEGSVRVWFPQLPELGYWDCEAGHGSKAEVHREAARVLTEEHGLESGSFTLSLHDADGCAEPAMVAATRSSPEVERPVPASQWGRIGGWLLPRVRTAAEIGAALIWGIGLAATYNLIFQPHNYIPPLGIVVLGMALGLNALSWRSLARAIREVLATRRAKKALS